MNFTWLGDAFLRRVDDWYEERAHRAGAEMVRIARMLAAKDTGLMAASTYYTYLPAQRLLTLHCDVGYAEFQERGTWKMRAHPFMRPAIAAAAPAFGIRTHMMLGTYNAPDHVPHRILSHIRPQIAATNLRLNRGKVAKAAVTNIHMNRQNEALRHTAPTGHRFVMKSSASHLNRLRRAWN